ncbi:MAG: hypothetical protein RMY30_038275 [Nostoc sp. CmiSLP01]|nr:hypothetical protein [Nostoc sp. CmiSLP01]MDZ8286016.1 hypothetical protein [Nostoc sp. ChiSLP01]
MKINRFGKAEILKALSQAIALALQHRFPQMVCTANPGKFSWILWRSQFRNNLVLAF